MIKVPGPSADRPNAYSFGTSYEAIYQDLKAKDTSLYTQNGLLMLLDRNRRIKERPQRFQDSSEKHDVIVSCEERCYELVCEELQSRMVSEECGGQPVVVINVDIRDTPEDAVVGARTILQIVQRLEESQLEDAARQVSSFVKSLEAEEQSKFLFTVLFC